MEFLYRAVTAFVRKIWWCLSRRRRRSTSRNSTNVRIRKKRYVQVELNVCDRTQRDFQWNNHLTVDGYISLCLCLSTQCVACVFVCPCPCVVALCLCYINDQDSVHLYEPKAQTIFSEFTFVTVLKIQNNARWNIYSSPQAYLAWITCFRLIPITKKNHLFHNCILKFIWIFFWICHISHFDAFIHILKHFNNQFKLTRNNVNNYVQYQTCCNSKKNWTHRSHQGSTSMGAIGLL